MQFSFDSEKNKKLKKLRDVTFDDVIHAISEDRLLLDIKHPNSNKYPDQRVMVVEIRNYTFVVPYLMKGNEIRLITIFPDRRFKHLLGGGENEK